MEQKSGMQHRQRLGPGFGGFPDFFGGRSKKCTNKPMYFRLVPAKCFQFLLTNSNATIGNVPLN